MMLTALKRYLEPPNYCRANVLRSLVRVFAYLIQKECQPAAPNLGRGSVQRQVGLVSILQQPTGKVTKMNDNFSN